MFGYVTNNGSNIKVSNRIFETRLYNLFLSEEELSNMMSKLAKQEINQFVSGSSWPENDHDRKQNNRGSRCIM